MTGLGVFHVLAPTDFGASIAGFTDGLGLWQQHSLTLLHAGGGELTLLAGGVLWAAVELQAGSERITTRRLLAAIGYRAVMALGPLVALAFAVYLCRVGASPDRWLATVALIGASCVGAIAAVRRWAEFARGGFYRNAALVIGTSYGLPQMGDRLPGHDPAFVVTGVVQRGDRPALETKSLRKRGLRGIVAANEATDPNPELRKRCRREERRFLDEAEFREGWLRRVGIDRQQPGAPAAKGCIKGPLNAKLARRTADIVLSLLLLICTLPLSTVVAACIKFDSRGSIFSFQERVGLRGRLF